MTDTAGSPTMPERERLAAFIDTEAHSAGLWANERDDPPDLRLHHRRKADDFKAIAALLRAPLTADPPDELDALMRLVNAHGVACILTNGPREATEAAAREVLSSLLRRVREAEAATGIARRAAEEVRSNFAAEVHGQRMFSVAAFRQFPWEEVSRG